MSELALGWATYNGDHMSMYGVNASVPKDAGADIWCIMHADAGRRFIELKEVLYDVLDTPVSPELLPPKDGEIAQKTEDLVGPYELHDFLPVLFPENGIWARRKFTGWRSFQTFAGEYDDCRRLISGFSTFCWTILFTAV